MKKVILYIENNCSLCEDAKALLTIFKLDHEIDIEERNIKEKNEWLFLYQLKVPVIQIDQAEFFSDEINYERIEQALS